MGGVRGFGRGGEVRAGILQQLGVALPFSGRRPRGLHALQGTAQFQEEKWPKPHPP